MLNEDSPSLQYSAVVLEIHGLSIYEALIWKNRQIYYQTKLLLLPIFISSHETLIGVQ